MAARFPDPRELVDAAPARAHLDQLRAVGVGYRQAARLARLSPTLVADVRSGRARRLTAVAATRLLAIPAVLAHGQLVTGWRTWRLIESLQREGFTNRAIARKLGLRSGQLQLHHRRIRVRNALRVRALWRHINEEGPTA